MDALNTTSNLLYVHSLYKHIYILLFYILVIKSIIYYASTPFVSIIYIYYALDTRWFEYTIVDANIFERLWAY